MLHNVRTVKPQVLDPYVTLHGNNALEGGVIATQNNDPASFEFVLENRIGDTPLHFSINLQYLNSGFGNQIDLLARFDDEPFMPLVSSAGPDATRSIQADLFRKKPFKRLTLQVRMYCKDDTAQYFGGNLRSLIFQELSVTLSQDGAILTKPSAGAAPSPQ